jgi:hypothetical protein
MNDRTMRAAGFGLFLGLLCAGCGKSPSAPAASVPTDCQTFLDKYFAALKSKDIGKLQEFSGAFISTLSPAGGAEMPANVSDMARENARKMVADLYGKQNDQFGDFQSYSVVSVKETPITTADPEAPQMMKAGTHTEIVCNAKFSKSSGRIQFNLFKEKPDSEYSIEAWRYVGQP